MFSSNITKSHFPNFFLLSFSLLLLYTCSNTENETQKKLNLPEMPFLIIESNNIVKGDIEICRFITKLTGTYEFFFGKSQEEENSHLDFINKFNLSAEYLDFLNNHLITRTFCNGNAITISDFYAFGYVIQEVLRLTDDKKWKFCNVIRWVDHIQNLVGLKEQLERLKFLVSLPFEPLLLEPKVKIEEKKHQKDHKDKEHHHEKHDKHEKHEKHENKSI